MFGRKFCIRSCSQYAYFKVSVLASAHTDTDVNIPFNCRTFALYDLSQQGGHVTVRKFSFSCHNCILHNTHGKLNNGVKYSSMVIISLADMISTNTSVSTTVLRPSRTKYG
jgi:hypothetical protein